MEHEDEQPLLTPEELVDYPLRRAARGYAVKEVDDLLDALAAQTERLLGAVDAAHHERDARDQRIRQLEQRLVQLEQATEHELAAARRVGEGIVADARRVADEAAEEGRLRAREHMESALRRIRAEEADLLRRQSAMSQHLATLRQFATDHRLRLQQHLHHELERLDALVVPSEPDEPALARDPMLDEPGLAGPPSEPTPRSEPRWTPGATAPASSRRETGATWSAGDAVPAPGGGTSPSTWTASTTGQPAAEDPVPPTPWDVVSAADRGGSQQEAPERNDVVALGDQPLFDGQG